MLVALSIPLTIQKFVLIFIDCMACLFLWAREKTQKRYAKVYIPFLSQQTEPSEIFKAANKKMSNEKKQFFAFFRKLITTNAKPSIKKTLLTIFRMNRTHDSGIDLNS